MDRKQEIEKIKQMPWKKRLEYIWMYYKIWFFGFLCLILLIKLGLTMYQGMQQTPVLEVAVVGAGSQSWNELKDDAEKWIGADGKKDVVLIHGGMPGDANNATTRTTLTTLLEANAVDVLIAPKEIYEQYESQGALEDIHLFIDESDESMVEGNAICLSSDSKLAKELDITYHPVYLFVPVNVQERENAKVFLEEVMASEAR